MKVILQKAKIRSENQKTNRHWEKTFFADTRKGCMANYQPPTGLRQNNFYLCASIMPLQIILNKQFHGENSDG
ncbi:MAG: hypothetical protein EA394_00595 [Bacteroidia bacterium]|nr:MAG: hypothetical protein EA394_00595 [Bacteroidia bacterium]